MSSMNATELVIWSAMLGGIGTLAVVAIADVVANRTTAAWRGLFFLVLTGGASLVGSGLPEYLWPDSPATLMLVLRCSLGPLSGAIALNYLGLWLGSTAEDTRIGATVVGGSIFLALGAVALGIAASTASPSADRDVMAFSAIVSCVGVALMLYVSVRASQLGDPLARWMVVAGLFLAIMVAGLHTYQLNPGYLSPVLLTLTAFSVVAFFLVVVALTINRNRLYRQLERLAGLSQGTDVTTGLPTGSVLMSKVDDAVWRNARTRDDFAVICLHLRNLYELGEVAGHGVEHQILAAMSARVRRAVGFRCIVGLYHPRCFVVIVSAVKSKSTLTRLEARLQHLVSKPLIVIGVNNAYHAFTPRFGMGTVTSSDGTVDPAALLDRAEHLALARESTPNDLPSDAEASIEGPSR
jgi:GGDEF domain-containing protein